MRSRWQLGVICCAVLLLGGAGGATGPTKVYAENQRAAQDMAEPAGRSAGVPAPAPRNTGVRCKLTKECQKISATMVCQKFGDHKECLLPAMPVPVGRPNT